MRSRWSERPVRQQQGLVALPVVCFEVAATGLAVVDAQAGFSLDGHTREPLSVGFTERAAGSLELPARAAAAAREQTPAPGVDADQLGHRGQGSARRAIPAKPPLLVSPTVEGVHHGTEEPRHRRPPQITQQPGERRCERLVAQQKVRDAARDLGLAPQFRVERAGLRRELPDDVPEASLSRSAAAIRPPGSRSTAASALDSSGTPARKSAR